ncbi:MAG: ROK family protein [Phycisphaerales bacterium]|nr:ROK family protein [Phycisphaerales bacterium]
MPSHHIGIDLGGTKIEGVVLAPDGRESNRLRVPTPRGDYDGTIAAIVDLVKALQPDGEHVTVGVGTPGSANPATGLHRNSNSTCLNGRPFEADLAAQLDWPLAMGNDANCFALSEAVDGAGRDGRVVFGVILGTGCGGGVVIDREVVVGLNGIGGEWGHMALPRRDGAAWSPRPCYCGRHDCLEQYISGSALEAEYLAATGRSTTVEQMLAGVDDDQAAAQIFEVFHDQLAESLVTVIDLLDPDVVVLGGGLSNLDSIYEKVPPLVHARAFSDHCETPIRRAVHGDSSGVRGAAWLHQGGRSNG